jgi:hypothetical protein
MLRRRLFLAAPAFAVLPGTVFAENAAIGRAVQLQGRSSLTRGGVAGRLRVEDTLMEGDAVSVGPKAAAALELFTSTFLNLGPGAELVLDKFIAELGGTITLGGAMVFDRADDLPKLDLTVQNAFAQIGVRGTRFFAGPSNGVYGVFVVRGRVRVTAGGVMRRLGPGDGVDIAEHGAGPSRVAQWKAPRIEAAFASVGLTP